MGGNEARVEWSWEREYTICTGHSIVEACIVVLGEYVHNMYSTHSMPEVFIVVQGKQTLHQLAPTLCPKK